MDFTHLYSLNYLKLLFLFLLCCTASICHPQEFLGDDYEHFARKAELYSDWLEARGLDRFFSIDTIKVVNEGYELELWLNTVSNDSDSTSAIWVALEEEFRRRKTNLTNLLFSTFVRYMEVPGEQANLRLNCFNDVNSKIPSPCFKIWIWEENGQVKSEQELFGCRSVKISVTIDGESFNSLYQNEEEPISGENNIDYIFDRILDFMNITFINKPSSNECINRTPRIEEIDRSDYSLNFVVSDLCKEILTEEKKSIWCQLIELRLLWSSAGCNDIKRERLEFEFNLFPDKDNYILKATVTGKFGSGKYVPRRSAYSDMDPDFEEDFLIPYMKDLKIKLQEYLED